MQFDLLANFATIKMREKYIYNHANLGYTYLENLFAFWLCLEDTVCENHM